MAHTTPAAGRQRQADLEFEPSLVYRVNSRTARAGQRSLPSFFSYITRICTEDGVTDSTVQERPGLKTQGLDF